MKRLLMKEYASMKQRLLDDRASTVLPRYKTFLLNFTQYGLNFMVILLSVIVVPAQVERLVKGSRKGRAMGGMIAGGAVATLLVCPIMGMISDRSICRVGKRRPMILVCTACLCVGLLGMAISAPHISPHGNPMEKVGTLSIQYNGRASTEGVVAKAHWNKAARELHCDVDLVARRCLPYQDGTSRSSTHTQAPPSYEVGNVASHAQGIVLPRYTPYKYEETKPTGNLGFYIVFFLLVVISQAGVAIPYLALVADKTHPSQRGFNSGVMGAMVLLGSVSGAAAGISFTHIGVLFMYTIIIAVVVISVLITTFSITEDPGHPELRPPPLNFKLVFYGFVEPLKDHDFRWVFITRFFMQQGVATITGSLVFGMLSDKTGRRKIIVAMAAFIMAIGSFVNAFLFGSYAYFIAALMAFLIGLGFGAFQAVDFALVMDILTDEAETAKDVAVWHQSLILPQAIATPLGGLILDLFEKVNCKIALGYIILFILASVYLTLSGIFVFKIRRAR